MSDDFNSALGYDLVALTFYITIYYIFILLESYSDKHMVQSLMMNLQLQSIPSQTLACYLWLNKKKKLKSALRSSSCLSLSLMWACWKYPYLLCTLAVPHKPSIRPVLSLCWCASGSCCFLSSCRRTFYGLPGSVVWSSSRLLFPSIQTEWKRGRCSCKLVCFWKKISMTDIFM